MNFIDRIRIRSSVNFIISIIERIINLIIKLQEKPKNLTPEIQPDKRKPILPWRRK